ncbi:hypothetical protein DASB73_025490 [Starmerella bacillaris]|uniref:Molybdenum cofactor sulfurase middle domain-containing protein n=1 Tax=Starmerella bacillaris TaxID=1247836 RepID=A0AAV5RJ51_STABA|nr:hypothetical protein DASB73_025490 [Starmerella bacillaris]
MSYADMEIKQIFIYPFKSLNGIEVREILITEHGFLHDRMYMLAHKNDQGEYIPVTRSAAPELNDIQVNLHERDFPEFQLSYTLDSELFQLELPFAISKLPSTMESIDIHPWSDTMTCYDLGAKVPQYTQFFQRLLKDKFTDLTVVVTAVKRKHPDTGFIPQKFSEKNCPERFANYQDLWPGTLLSTGTILSLEEPNHSTSLADLRANLVVESAESFSECRWRELMIANHLWKVDVAVSALAKTNSEVNFFVLHGRTRGNTKLPYYGSNIINHDYNYVVKLGDRVDVIKEV